MFISKTTIKVPYPLINDRFSVIGNPSLTKIIED